MNQRGSCLLVCLSLAAAPVFAQEAVQEYSYTVLNTYPHNIESFTQGLVYQGGYLWEGTGKNGLSTLSKINLEDGQVLMEKRLNRRYFGEGIEIVGDKIYQLTWQSNMVFVYEKESFDTAGSHYNPTEGWGLAYDGSELILSNGTSVLQFLEPETFTPTRKINVSYNGNPLPNLNELEFIEGEIWANVWQTNFIVRIDPKSGEVTSVIDFTGLSDLTELGSNEAVLNGVAWDAEQQRLFVTGKHWANLFEVELVAR
ncbi:MAG: glutamine cyclotransferase [Gammaproteobacteria bacterium]|nr:glutamine cyclotransferase [Gammaproteobacteria bacterium]HJN95767.1 glutaminyl-peptide cyclotransferase [Gammaproteobacteria bacterium]